MRFRGPTLKKVERLDEVPTCLGESLPSIRIAVTTERWDECGETLEVVVSTVVAHR